MFSWWVIKIEGIEFPWETYSRSRNIITAPSPAKSFSFLRLRLRNTTIKIVLIYICAHGEIAVFSAGTSSENIERPYKESQRVGLIVWHEKNGSEERRTFLTFKYFHFRHFVTFSEDDMLPFLLRSLTEYSLGFMERVPVAWPQKKLYSPWEQNVLHLLPCLLYMYRTLGRPTFPGWTNREVAPTWLGGGACSPTDIRIHSVHHPWARVSLLQPPPPVEKLRVFIESPPNIPSPRPANPFTPPPPASYHKPSWLKSDIWEWHIVIDQSAEKR